MPLKKVLTFNRKEDFYMDIKVSNPERLPECDSPMIGAYNISGVEKAVGYNETEKPKISITFELDRSGLLVVTKAEGKAESWTEETVVKKKEAKNATEDETASGDDSEEKSDSEQEAEKTEEAAEESADASSETEESESETKEEEAADGEKAEDEAPAEETEEEEEEETEIKLVKKVHRVALDWNFTAVDMTPLTEAHSKASKKMMSAIQKRMDDIAEMNKIKNDVEAHVFQTRDAFEYNEELKNVMSEEEMDTIRSSLSEVEEWLWDDHELQEYKDKLKELRKEMKPANTRKQELEDRPKALAQAKEQIESIKAYVLNETAMENVNVNDTAIIQSATEAFEAWIAEKEAAQEALALTEPPAVLASEIVTEAEEHRNKVSEALRPKVKPKPKKKDGPVETKKEKAARIKFEKAEKSHKKANKKLDDLMEKLGKQCGLPETCEPAPVEKEEPAETEASETEEAKEEDGEETKEEAKDEPVDCSFTEGEPDTCGEGCVYTAAVEATEPTPAEEEAADEEEPAAEDGEEKEKDEDSGDDAAAEGEDAAEKDADETKPKKAKDPCGALSKSIKKAKKSLKTATRSLTKAEEEYKKEKEFVEANRAARLAKEAKAKEEAEAKKKAREEKKKKKKKEEDAEAEDEEGDDVESDDEEKPTEEAEEGADGDDATENEEEGDKDEL